MVKTNKYLVVLESSYLLKNFLFKTKLSNELINNIEFIATNGSIFKYNYISGDIQYKLKFNALNIKNKISNFKGKVIIATDNDNNGDMIALEISSLNKNCYKLNILIEDLIKSKETLTIKKIEDNISNKINITNLIENIVLKVKNETETKDFYIKTGLKLSIDDRVMIKVLNRNLPLITKNKLWVNNINKKNKQDLYTFLAKTVEKDFDINTIYEQLLSEYEKGNISYIRTNGESHNFIEIFNEFNINSSIKNIFNSEININILENNKESFKLLTDNFFIISKLLNIGTPSSIYFIYKNVMENINKSKGIEDNIDINYFLEKKNIFSSNKSINLEENSLNKFIEIVNNVFKEETKKDMKELDINKKIDSFFK